MRKLFVLISVLVVALAMTSCLDNVHSDYTPEIKCSYLYVNPILNSDTIVGAKDTLRLTYDDKDNSFVTDTLALGDTLMFSAAYYTVSKNLIAVKIAWDSTETALWYPLNTKIEDVLTDRSDVAAGQLYFNPGYNFVAFPIYVSPKQVGKTSFSLTVESDSKFPTASLKFVLPVSKVDSVSL